MLAFHDNVGRLVAERPERARVFEEFDIDYCCGGKRALGDACARLGIDPAVVLKGLEAIDVAPRESERNWDEASITDLCDHIVETHHAFRRRELPRLTRLFEKIARVHSDRHRELIRLHEIYGAFAQDLELDMDKEGRVLFSLLKRLAFSDATPNRSVLAPIRGMEAEHDNAGRALEGMRRLTNGFRPPADACNTYRAPLPACTRLSKTCIDICIWKTMFSSRELTRRLPFLPTEESFYGRIPALPVRFLQVLFLPIAVALSASPAVAADWEQKPIRYSTAAADNAMS